MILVGILSILILSVKNRVGLGVGGVLLNGQNPLSVTKVICRQSLNDECPRFCQVPSQDTVISVIPWSSTFSFNWSAAAIIDSVATTLYAFAIFFWVSLNAPTCTGDKKLKSPQIFSYDESPRPISLIAITDRILMSKGAFPFPSFSTFLLVYISLDHMWQFLHLNFKQQLNPFFFEWSISKHKFLLSHSGHVPIRLIMSDNMSKSIIMFENVEEFSLISFFGFIVFCSVQYVGFHWLYVFWNIENCQLIYASQHQIFAFYLYSFTLSVFLLL